MNNHVMEKVLAKENLKLAWKQVKSNKGAPGIDGVSIDAYPEYHRKKWPKARKGLIEGNYIPSPVKRVEIPKKSGGKRKLGIPTVKDRLIQQAISQVLTKIFDSEFSESSFGFRPGRSAHDAIYQMQKQVNMGYHWVVDIDLEKFFDNVNHDILMSRVGRRVRDEKSKITRANDSSFLGFTLKNGKIRWTEDSFRDFKYNFKKLTGRSNGISLSRRII